MALGIYKKGQGYWTRVMTAIGGGTMVLMGAIWIGKNFRNAQIAGLEPIYIQAIAFLLTFGVLAWVGYWVICRQHKVVDFLIATEGEMKKVNWSSKREIRGSTVVVIALTFIIAVLIAILDLFYAEIFHAINVLETTPAT